MSAASVLLTANSPEFTWDPRRTYFETKSASHADRSRESYEIPFDNPGLTFGRTGVCTIPNKGDYMTRLTLRTVLPPIYPTVSGQYVFPTPSSSVGGTVYVNKTLTLVSAAAGTLTANTVGNHYFSTGAQVTLSGTTSLDGTYTVATIPTANSFTCSTGLTGTSTTGTVSTPGIQCGDIISYFSSTNSNLWVNNITNKTWQITAGSNVGTTLTFTTATPSNFPVGSQVVLNLANSIYLNTKLFTVTASTDTTFTCTVIGNFVTANEGNQAYSTDNGVTWTSVTPPLAITDSQSLAFGNGVFVTVGFGTQARSTNNGLSWSLVASPLAGSWYGVAFGNGVFVMVGKNTFGFGSQALSTDNGLTWTTVASPLSIGYSWYSAAFGNNTFVMVDNGTGYQARSTNNGVTWTIAATTIPGSWQGVAFGNSVFVIVGNNVQGRSTNDGVTWTSVASPLSGNWQGVAFGNGVFIMGSKNTVGAGSIARSTDNGLTWSIVSTPISDSNWGSITFANNVFVMIGSSHRAYSLDNGVTWQYATGYLPSESINNVSYIAYGNFTYTNTPSDSVTLAVPPLQVTNRVFSSNVYPSISFANASDAAFWGFDSRQGFTYSLPATPPWTYTQSGWTAGFLPPSTSTYDDSVAHKLCKSIRILVGKQTIKEYTGEYIELQNDLLVPYENKAILKLMNGTLDQTQAIVPREYYVNLPLGTREIPLCALTNQRMSVEVDFDSYLNVSQNLNQGTGSFLDAKSYTTYDILGLLSSSSIQTTFSYQQYVFISLYTTKFIIFDTTKKIDDPTSYTVISIPMAPNGGIQFCVLSGILYIGLATGFLARMTLSEVVQGNTSSFLTNGYTPGTGILIGNMVADFRYVYYAMQIVGAVRFIRYDTTVSFTSPSSYTAFNFTSTFDTNVTGVYQILSTGTQLVLLPQGSPGKLYTYQLNANVQSQWYALDYSSYGYQISGGVLVGSSLYFICDNFTVLKYTNSTFTPYLLCTDLFLMINGSGQQSYSTSKGVYWTPSSSQTVSGTWNAITSGNGVSVMVGTNVQARSTDNGLTWSYATTQLSGSWSSVAFGNGVFVMITSANIARSTDNGRAWTSVAIPFGTWNAIAFGNGVFVLTGVNNQARSTDNGLTWNYASIQVSGVWSSLVYGNGVFVMIGSDIQARSTDNGVSWTTVATPLLGSWYKAAFGNGVFVTVSPLGRQAYSTNNGVSWTAVVSPLAGSWNDVTFGNGVFVMVGVNKQGYSTNNGLSWTAVASPISGSWTRVCLNSAVVSIPGNSLSNLLAVGTFIYASTNNVAVQIDTTKDLSTTAAYAFPAPSLPIRQYGFANGPRYVYMIPIFYSLLNTSPTKIFAYDPYAPDTTFNASVIVDYESLPSETKKPGKALLPLIQTQKVTDMTHMNIKGPVKEIWVTGASSSTNVFQYSNLTSQSTLTFAGEQIVTPDIGTRTFLNTIQPFETHTSMPVRNVSVVPFEYDPESDVPNGTVNFSRLRDQMFVGNAATVWTRSVNLLAVQDGIGGLLFN